MLVYYNQVLGLEPALAGLALALALVVDAVTDPLVGVWSDRARTRWGRRHPSCMPASCRLPSRSMPCSSRRPTSAKAACSWRLLCLAVAVRVSMTLYEIPRGALGPELTKDYDQRTQLIGWSTSYGWFGGAGFAWADAGLFCCRRRPEYQGSRAYLNPARLPGYGLDWGTDHFCDRHDFNARPASAYPRSARSRGRRCCGFSPRKLGREIVETLSNRSWFDVVCRGAGVCPICRSAQQYGPLLRPVFLAMDSRARPDFSRCPYVHRHQLRAAGLSADARAGPRSQTAIGLFLLSATLGPLPVVLRLLDPLVAVPLFPANWQRRFMVAALASQCVSGVAGGRWFYPGRLHDADIVEESQRKTRPAQ